MKQIKVIAGLTHQQVEKEVNKWMVENSHLKVEDVFQSEWMGDQGRSFTITLIYEVDEKKQVKAAIPVNMQ
ncbi:MAG: hypothetical protein IIC93_03650 [Chloroflexi bacterium]|nr:hypothetical protein [Chloroflexota bacterium]